MLTMWMPSRMWMRLWIRMRPGPWPWLGRRSRSVAMMAMSLSIWFFVYCIISLFILSSSPSFSPSLLLLSFSLCLQLLWIPRFPRGKIRPISAGRDNNRILDGFDVTHRSLPGLLHIAEPPNSLSFVEFEHFACDLLDGFEARVEQFPPIQRRKGNLEGSTMYGSARKYIAAR